LTNANKVAINVLKVNPNHPPTRVHDNEESLVHAEVCKIKMAERPGHALPINNAKLNALYDQFVPQMELSREQVYWLPTTEFASQSSTLAKHVAHFVHTRPVKSDVHKKLQGRDDSIRNLHAQNDIMSLLNVGSTDDRCNKQALETELTQLKDTVTSLKVQNDGYKVINENLNRCYEELSKANTHLRTTSLEKIVEQKAEIATLNAKTVGNKTSGTTKLENPKVIAPGMYAISPKYIETPKPSPRFIKKPVAPLLKKPNVNIPLSTRIKSATGANKPAIKSNAWIYRKLPAKSAKGEKVEEHIRNLNKINRVDYHVKLKFVNRKQPNAKNTVRTTKKVWRPKGWKAGSKGIPAMIE
nr:hypothetical protein [Tanacetum cinerariifolium]